MTSFPLLSTALSVSVLSLFPLFPFSMSLEDPGYLE
jgi:hypothetical protein